MAIDKNQVTQKVQQLMRKGQWEKAVEEMNRLCKEDSSDPLAALRLGDLYLKAGDKAKAAESYYRSAGLFDNNGHTAKAIATFKMIQRIDPDYKDVDERLVRLAAEKSASVKGARTQPQDKPVQTSRSVEVIELSETPVSDIVITQGGVEVSADYGNIEPPAPSATTEQDSLDEGVIGGSGLDPVGAASPGIEVQANPGAVSEESSPAAPPIPLFSDIPRDELWSILGRMNRRTYDTDETIVHEGEEGDSLFIIRSGGARVITRVKGIEVLLAELGERDFFGEVSFLTGRPRTADIVATEPTEILELTGEELRGVIERYPAVDSGLRMFHENRVEDTVELIKAVPKELFS